MRSISFDRWTFEKQAALDHLTRDAARIRPQVEDKHSLFHAHMLVGLWGGLEAFVDDFAVAWLSEHPDLVLTEPISRIKVALGDYVINSEQGNEYRFIINEIRRSNASDLKRGISQFDSVLSALGLGGPVDPRIRNSLAEQHHLARVQGPGPEAS
ncbi:MAG: hypothetical protein ABI047_03345 [Jatrophihabitantaceae bacterium]